MEKKVFQSRLFKKTIYVDAPDYWQMLYSEILFRLNVLRDLNCPCTFCFREVVHLKNILMQMAKDGHIDENPKSDNFTGQGNCGRRLGPAA